MALVAEQLQMTQGQGEANGMVTAGGLGSAFAALQALTGPPPLHANALFLAAQQALHAVQQAQQQQLLLPPVPPLSLMQEQQQQQHLESPRHAAASDGSSGRTEDQGGPQLMLPSTRGVAGVKLPITCNDVRGVVYLDQQVVACYCATCAARVATGHDRPLFSFTRFERHCGSKAKKWRISLRIEPGSAREVPPGDPPMPLGQWLEMKGLMSWAPRTAIKVGHSGSDDEGDGTLYQRQAAVAPMGERPLSGGHYMRPQMVGVKRQREQYDTPDLPDQSDRQAWLEAQRDAFAAAAEGDDSACRAAIFRLVYGLLEGADRRDFNELYLPWLNDLLPPRLQAEFGTLRSYLGLLAGMPKGAVEGQMRAYLRSMLARLGGGLPAAPPALVPTLEPAPRSPQQQ